MRRIERYGRLWAIRATLLAAVTTLALLTAHPLPSSAQPAETLAVSSGQQMAAPKEPGKAAMEVADSIAKTTNDAWKIAESQWRSANAYADGLKSIATAIGAPAAIFIAALGFMGYANIRDIKKDVKEEIQQYEKSVDDKIKQIELAIHKESVNLEKIFPVLVRKEIDSIFEDNDGRRKHLEESAKRSADAAEKMQQFLNKYESETSPFMDAAKGISDPIGDFRDLIRNNAAENEVSDPLHRHKIRKVLQNFIDNQDIVGVNELFNATNMAAHLGYTDQAKKLGELAYKRWPIPIHEARMLRFQVPQGGEAGDKAFRRIMELVATTPTSNCELIIADGWNVAEERRDYDSFLAAAEKRRLSNDYVPSYLHAVAAQAAVRGSQPGWKDKAESYLAAAKEAIATESPKSTWFMAAQREIRKVEQWMQPPSPGNNSGGANIKGEILARLLQEKFGALLSDEDEDDEDGANKTIPGNGKGNGRNDGGESEMQ